MLGEAKVGLYLLLGSDISFECSVTGLQQPPAMACMLESESQEDL